MPPLKGQIPYWLSGELTDLVLNVAVVSKTTTTDVKRGENEGRRLSHNNVVRVFERVAAKSAGEFRLSLPTDFSTATGAVVAYVQSRRTGAILGADAIDLH